MSSQEMQWRQVEPTEGADTLHYNSCGLPNIYLAGGFTRHKTNYGDGVSIVNVEGLHRAIGESLICSERSLSGPEIRFLRKEMKLTQDLLAEFLKIGTQQVARWEKEECSIPGPADILVRALYKQHVGKQPNVKKISAQLHQTTEHSTAKPVFFEQMLEAA
jgi:putative transcriptional regulator